MTTQPISKYDGVKTEVLIKYVQAEVHATRDPKYKKKARTKKVVEKLAALREIQYELAKRFKKMNRLDPHFFPVGSLVEFNKSENLKAFHAEGVVEGYTDDGRVMVNFKGDATYQLAAYGSFVLQKVEPKYLKLLYLRHSYI